MLNESSFAAMVHRVFCFVLPIVSKKVLCQEGNETRAFLQMLHCKLQIYPPPQARIGAVDSFVVWIWAESLSSGQGDMRIVADDRVIPELLTFSYNLNQPRTSWVSFVKYEGFPQAVSKTLHPAEAWGPGQVSRRWEGLWPPKEARPRAGDFRFMWLGTSFLMLRLEGSFPYRVSLIVQGFHGIIRVWNTLTFRSVLTKMSILAEGWSSCFSRENTLFQCLLWLLAAPHSQLSKMPRRQKDLVGCFPLKDEGLSSRIYLNQRLKKTNTEPQDATSYWG